MVCFFGAGQACLGTGDRSGDAVQSIERWIEPADKPWRGRGRAQQKEIGQVPDSVEDGHEETVVVKVCGVEAGRGWAPEEAEVKGDEGIEDVDLSIATTVATKKLILGKQALRGCETGE